MSWGDREIMRRLKEAHGLFSVSGLHCLKNEGLEAGSQFSDDLYAIITKNFLVVYFDDSHFAVFLPRIHIETYRVVIHVRPFPKSQKPGGN